MEVHDCFSITELVTYETFTSPIEAEPGEMRSTDSTTETGKSLPGRWRSEMLRAPDWRFRSAHALRNVSAIPGKGRGEADLQSPIWFDPQSGRGSFMNVCSIAIVGRYKD